ncbi:MAG: (4Fe-4S)-binding protein [Pseudomonadota bacterium]
MAKIKKTIKKIHVKADLCNGCRMCELMCSLFHSNAQLNTVNPARARIQILRDPLKNVWLPVFAGEYTPAECSGRISYEIDNKTYKECAFCRAVCPSRGRFVEPDSGLPLGCDMCQSDPTLKMPVCVDWCIRNVLTYEEREVEVEAEEEVKLDDMKVGLQALANRYGVDELRDAVTRMAQKG